MKSIMICWLSFFVTTNSYDHLHLPTDEVGTLNPALYEKVVRLAHLTALEVANGNYIREEILDNK